MWISNSKESKQQEEVVMAKPLKEDSAIKLANIIGKLIADVEKLKKDLDSLAMRSHTTAQIVAVMMNDVTNPETQKEIMLAMMSNEDFIEFSSDHPATAEQAYDDIMSGKSPVRMPENMSKEDFIEGFNRTKEMFSFARHEMDLANDEQHFSDREEE